MSLRAVLDINVLIAAKKSHGPGSPNAEILDRWHRREFTFLYSLDTLAEYAEKLIDRGIPLEEVEAFVGSIARLGEAVVIGFFHFRHFPVDSDDVVFLLCAINGSASHLVSYDAHLLALRPFYAGELRICEPIDFLADLRSNDDHR